MTLLKIKRIKPNAVIPKQANPGDAGFDLTSTITVEIPPFSQVLIPTGLQMEIEPGYEGQVRSRSGLALKNGLTVLNSPGTVDSGYRGEVGIILYNATRETAYIQEGDRVAQMVIQAVPQLTIEEVEDELSETQRGEGGFGSTGVK